MISFGSDLFDSDLMCFSLVASLSYLIISLALDSSETRSRLIPHLRDYNIHDVKHRDDDETNRRKMFHVLLSASETHGWNCEYC